MKEAAAGRRPGPNEPCWCGSGHKYKRCHREADQGAAAPVVRQRFVRPGRVSPPRAVPPGIRLPEWARTGDVSDADPDESVVQPPHVVQRMRAAGRAAAEVLRTLERAVRPGVTTDALDGLAHDEIVRRRAYPSPLNYRGYPKSLCTSVNEVICHGIPDDRALEEGDIINLDVTLYLDGVHGDCSATFLVGEVDEESRRLVRVTHECMMVGIRAVKPGRPVRDIGRAIEQHARRHGMGTVRAFCGHAIGERFHGALQVPHFDDPDAKTVMRPGMTFTVEPMITLGTWRHAEWDDGWTAVTADGRRTAQFEHTVLVTDEGVDILTLLPD
ncbi:MAG: type I methionyl aminopeptidase [Deltaproteobacteria bacterium]|nr:type I methionyl aminopeptidase [Deltaproteobacteria bacterium]